MSFGFGFGFTKITAAIRAAFSPSSLFAANEPGVWYDPSDLSTLFQDAAGTTPVTAVEQPVGLMLDKSKGLVLGPELVAPINFLSGWSTSGAAVTFDSATSYTSAGVANVFFPCLTVGKTYRISINVSFSAGAVILYNGTSAVNLIGSTLASGVTQTLFFTAAATQINIRPTAAATVTVNSISVRELPGNHASQPTATSRPVLSARVNLLTYSEQFDNAAWNKAQSTITPNAAIAPDGTLTADKLVEDSSTASHYIARQTSVTAATTHTDSWFVKKGERSNFVIACTGATTTAYAGFDLATGTITTTGGAGYVSSGIQDHANGWYRVWLVFTAQATENLTIQRRVIKTSGLMYEAYTGDGTSGIYIWGADLRVANTGAGLPAYQRVNTATDYDTAGFPHYLRFDGVDDWLVTNTITPGTDKAQVFAGVRKLSDAAIGILMETSIDATSAGYPGSFAIFAPGAAGDANYRPFFRGDVGRSFETLLTYSAPITNVLAIQMSNQLPAAGDAISSRINGVAVTATESSNITDAGNYLAYPLYIGRRAGTSLPFNGHLYSLIVRFGANLPTATIEKTEKYINTKTRAY